MQITMGPFDFGPQVATAREDDICVQAGSREVLAHAFYEEDVDVVEREARHQGPRFPEECPLSLNRARS